MNSKFAPPSEEELKLLDETNSSVSSKFAPPSEEDLKLISEEDRTLDKQLKIKTAATTAALGTEALRRGISGAGQYGLEKIGKLTPQQMEAISKDIKTYSEARPFSDLIEEFKQLGQQTREAGFTARVRGVESLSDIEKFKASELISSLGRLEKAPKLTLTPDELPKAKPDISKINRLEGLLKQKEKLETSLNAIKESGIESFEIDKQINEATKQLEKVNSQISKNLPASIEEKVFPSIQPTISDFAKATNLPPELIAARPDLTTTKIPKEYGMLLQKEIDFLKTGEMTPKEMGRYIKKLQDAASYTPFPTEQEKFKQEIARVMSEELKSRPGSELYAKGQELSKKAIELEKGFKEFGLGLDSEGNIKIINDKKIEKIYKSGNQAEINRLNKYISEAQQLQLDVNVPLQSNIIPSEITKFQSELPFATIKKTVEEAKDLPLVTTAKRAAGSAIGGAVGGIPGAIAGYTGAGLLPTGTKLQEAASIAKGTRAYKAAAKASKALGPLGALIAGGMAYKGAEEVGLEGLEKLGVTAGEVVNPIPFTDVTGAYIAGKKELEKGIIPATKAAGEAFVKPAKEIIEQPTGIDYSSEILRKMERGEIIPKQKQPLVYKGTLKADNPVEISSTARALQSATDKASQEYGRVLSQIVDAPPREKESILFGLNQQPAFRELVRKLKGEQNTEE